MTPVIKHTAAQVQSLSQPIVYSVAGMTLFGLSVQDWVLVLTLVLVVLNLSLASIKLCSILRGKRNGD